MLHVIMQRMLRKVLALKHIRLSFDAQQCQLKILGKSALSLNNWLATEEVSKWIAKEIIFFPRKDTTN